MRLKKIKRPGGAGYFELEPLLEDEFGTWLHGPTGSVWKNLRDAGELPFDVVVLLHPERYFVAWWVDDPGDRRLEIDVCLCPQREHDGWSYIDLELDPVRHEDGSVEILDRDEFDVACRSGWIESEHAEIAHATALAMEVALRNREEPWGDEGWRRLDAVRRKRSHEKGT